MNMFSDRGCTEEENWYESEIQAALMDEFFLHLEKKIRIVS